MEEFLTDEEYEFLDGIREIILDKLNKLKWDNLDLMVRRNQKRFTIRRDELETLFEIEKLEKMLKDAEESLDNSFGI